MQPNGAYSAGADDDRVCLARDKCGEQPVLWDRLSGTLEQMTPLSAAAANNAAWCDLVCRTHGISADLDGAAWTSRQRTPPLHPDAVTLTPGLAAADLLARIDTSPGCSIKDSSATLDLTRHGFRVLFDAQWIARSPTVPLAATDGPEWTVIRGTDDFTAWERTWRGEHGPADVLRADLLREQSVTVMAAHVDGCIVGGAVLTRSAAVVGVSNFFADDSITSVGWNGCLALATELFPGETLVGYESGDALDAARTHGFEAVGPLRVWVHEVG